MVTSNSTHRGIIRNSKGEFDAMLRDMGGVTKSGDLVDLPVLTSKLQMSPVRNKRVFQTREIFKETKSSNKILDNVVYVLYSTRVQVSQDARSLELYRQRP
jgi:hypothetical protein